MSFLESNNEVQGIVQAGLLSLSSKISSTVV